MDYFFKKSSPLVLEIRQAGLAQGFDEQGRLNKNCENYGPKVKCSGVRAGFKWS